MVQECPEGLRLLDWAPRLSESSEEPPLLVREASCSEAARVATAGECFTFTSVEGKSLRNLKMSSLMPGYEKSLQNTPKVSI